MFLGFWVKFSCNTCEKTALTESGLPEKWIYNPKNKQTNKTTHYCPSCQTQELINIYQKSWDIQRKFNA